MVSIMLMCNDFCELFSIACRGKKHCVCNCAALWHTVKKMRKWTNCEQERRLKLEFPFQLFYACVNYGGGRRFGFSWKKKELYIFLIVG